MIQSQPSAAKPRNSLLPLGRAGDPPVRRGAAARSASSMRWKVRLELAPAEIAFVYRQGLARGAEVCRQGTQEWRPLVATPELRGALTDRANAQQLVQVIPPAGYAASPSQPLAIKDPSLAELFLSLRAAHTSRNPGGSKSAPPPAIGKSAPPPPPVIGKSEPPLPLFGTDSRPSTPLTLSESPRGWADAPLAMLSPLPPARLPPQRTPGPDASSLYARPMELSLVAGVAVVLTLGVTALTLWAEAPRLGSLESLENRIAPRPAVAESTPPPRPATGSTIPVVSLDDLPVQGNTVAALLPNALRVGVTPSLARSTVNAGPDRATLARALGNAAAAARNCGEGPVSAQVVVTFAPSGVARDIHFTAAPPLALRTCVLNAVARTHLSPFSGDPITVSKTLHW